MHKLKICFFFVSLLFISRVQTQETTEPIPTPPWNGDPAVCTSNFSPDPAKNRPIFGPTAEFSLEIEQDIEFAGAVVRQLSREQHLYSFANNKAIIVKNANDIITTTVFDYKKKYAFNYFAQTTCGVEPIKVGDEIDGRSAASCNDQGCQIRPLEEYLLFSYKGSDGREVYPVYKNSTTHRGILVNVWESCFVDKVNYVTIRRTWYMADPSVQTDYGKVGERAVPIYGHIVISKSLPNGTEILRTDERVNVEFFKPGIVEGNDALSAPKGVLCQIPNDTSLVSLTEVGIRWPDRFTVRVEATSSRSSRWERFHVSYVSRRSGENPFVRYDFLPEGAEDYRSIIHDDEQMLTYTIDQRRGTCRITRRVPDPDVSPILNPIEFFIKYAEDYIFYPSTGRFWSVNAVRTCRSNGVQCIIVTSEVPNFPPFVDSDTGYATGESWQATTIEQAWGRRTLGGTLPPNATRIFDYPVSLYMRSYRVPLGAAPLPANLRLQDIEYEFFDMGEDVNPYVFDLSSCYRSNNFEYQHLYFSVVADRDGVVDTPMFDRRSFQRSLVFHIARAAQVSLIRVSQLSFDHEAKGRQVHVFFTLLGRIYIPETDSFNDTEPTASDARKNLQQVIDSGSFGFNLTSDRIFIATFTGEKGTTSFASEYRTKFQARTSSTEYSAGSQALAVIVGLLIGLVVGGLGAYVIHRFRSGGFRLPSSVSNPRQSVNYSASGKSTASSA